MSEKEKKPTKRGVKKVEPTIVPLPSNEIKVEEGKYWIKNGIAVYHIDYPNIKMRVQEVKKFTKKLDNGSGEKKDFTFIKGVACTWLDSGHKFQKGVFHTRELRKWEGKD